MASQLVNDKVKALQNTVGSTLTQAVVDDLTKALNGTATTQVPGQAPTGGPATTVLK